MICGNRDDSWSQGRQRFTPARESCESAGLVLLAKTIGRDYSSWQVPRARPRPTIIAIGESPSEVTIMIMIQIELGGLKP
jgi:hypothetical protein